MLGSTSTEPMSPTLIRAREPGGVSIHSPVRTDRTAAIWLSSASVATSQRADRLTQQGPETNDDREQNQRCGVTPGRSPKGSRSGFSVRRRLDCVPQEFRSLDERNLLEDRLDGTDLFEADSASCTSGQMRIDTIALSSVKFSVDVRSQMILHMGQEDHFFPFSNHSRMGANFPASNLCPRLSLEETVPIEQFSTLAIS